ncbi:efflux RND transporter periplasmic adaptor subunit [Cypionkella sp.]|uniref:efflux RND transporter periplasmic adaptor subunit n=1 Tax=Cypionkella sp. TaxID=2811411 RepID=UPI0037529AB9
MRSLTVFPLLVAFAAPVFAEPMTLAPLQVTDWKAVYGRIEARDRIPARARLGGTLVALDVAEGDSVTAGQVLARIVDEKLAFQLSAIDAQLQAVSAQRDNAQVELKRGEDLLKQGVTTVQRLDGLRTQVDVLDGQIASISAQRRVIEQQAAEGSVLAPIAGRVLQVPAAKGAVVMAGETVANLGGGGIFLRLAVPERHAAGLREGDKIQIESATGAQSGTLVRIYPLIENGRVVADVEVDGLSDAFVDARVLVRLPVGTHEALMVPATALTTTAGLDYISANNAMRVVVPGSREVIDGVEMVEILSGLQSGDVIETDGAKHE